MKWKKWHRFRKKKRTCAWIAHENETKKNLSVRSITCNRIRFFFLTNRDFFFHLASVDTLLNCPKVVS